MIKSWWDGFRDRHCDTVDFILGDRGGILPGIWPAFLVPIVGIALLFALECSDKGDYAPAALTPATEVKK